MQIMKELVSEAPDDTNALQSNIAICERWANMEGNLWRKKAISAAAEAYRQYLQVKVKGLLNPCFYTTVAFTHGSNVLESVNYQFNDTLPDVIKKVARYKRQHSKEHEFFDLTERKLRDLFCNTKCAWIQTTQSDQKGGLHLMGIIPGNTIYAIWNTYNWEYLLKVTGDRSMFQFVNRFQLKEIIERTHICKELQHRIITFE